MIGDREKKQKSIDDLLKKAGEDPAFQKAFDEGRAAEPPKETKQPEKPEEVKQEIKPEKELKSYSYGKSLKLNEILCEIGMRRNVRAVDFADKQNLGIGYGHGLLSFVRLELSPLPRLVRVYSTRLYDEMSRPTDIRGISFGLKNRQAAVGTKKKGLRIYYANFDNESFIRRDISFEHIEVRQPSRVNDVAFNKDGSLLAVAGGKHGKQDGFLKLYDFIKNIVYPDLNLRWRARRTPYPWTAVAFTPDNNVLVGGRDMYVHSTTDLKKDPERIENDFWISALAFSKDGKYLATGHANFLRIHEYRPNSNYLPILATADFPDHIVHGLSFSQDGKYLAVTGGIPHRRTKEGKDGFVSIFEVK